ncbi:hypothetical protein SBV1_gp08 [Sulfolobales Beppu virus 1]|nr:hypothetical protein SBV1_gp08 [Sulfolobales Beppu virus 1]
MSSVLNTLYNYALTILNNPIYLIILGIVILIIAVIV